MQRLNFEKQVAGKIKALQEQSLKAFSKANAALDKPEWQTKEAKEDLVHVMAMWKFQGMIEAYDACLILKDYCDKQEKPALILPKGMQ